MEDNTTKAYNAKHITYGLIGLKAMEQGVNALTNLVKYTYGPRGYNVVLSRMLDAPIIINETSMICHNFTLDNHFANMGVQFLQEALLKVKNHAGDGTTTTAILMEAMISQGIKYIAAGANPMDLRKGMEKYCKEVLSFLSQISRSLHTEKDIQHLSRISSSNAEIASLLERAVSAVGKDGIIITGESKKAFSELLIFEGVILESGFVSNLMAKDTMKMETHLYNPYVFISKNKLTSQRDILPILEQIHQEKGSLLIIADSIEGEALSTIVTNVLKGTMSIVAIQAPDYGNQRNGILEDLAAQTGSIIYNYEMGDKIIPLDYFGRADEVIINKKTTHIINGNRNQTQISLRVKEIKEKLESYETQYDKEKLIKRLGNLMGKSAFIRIGAVTDVEIGDLLQKTDHSIRSVKEGLKYGVVNGGGSAYIQANKKTMSSLLLEGDEMLGARIMHHALERPARQLLENGNVSEDLIQYIVNQYCKEGNTAGFEIETEQWIDVYEQGLIDSLSMVKTALEVATSMAASFLTISVVVTDAVALTD